MSDAVKFYLQCVCQLSYILKIHTHINMKLSQEDPTVMRTHTTH